MNRINHDTLIKRSRVVSILPNFRHKSPRGRLSVAVSPPNPLKNFFDSQASFRGDESILDREKCFSFHRRVAMTVSVYVTITMGTMIVFWRIVGPLCQFKCFYNMEFGKKKTQKKEIH